MTINSDFVVVDERVQRIGDRPFVVHVNCRHLNSDEKFTVKFAGDRIRLVTPVSTEYQPIQTTTRKTSLFGNDDLPKKEIAQMDFQKTIELVGVACDYVREHYDLDINRSLWLGHVGDSQ